MDMRHKIVWSEGMLLTPHHFQHWDRYYEGLLSDKSQVLSPFGWGVCEIDIDRDGLANENFTLLGFRAVMPDGLMIRIPDMDLPPQTRPIGEFFLPSLEHLDVYLGISMEHVGGSNCDLGNTTSSRRSRYTGEYVSLPDQNTGDNPRELMVARKNLRIFFTGEDMPDSSVMKIAELVRTPGGTVVLRDAYIPPLLWMSGCDSLVRMVRSLRELLVSMGSALADQQRGIREHGGMDLLRFSMLHTIYSYIPILSHYSQVGRIHPEVLYLSLARLSGELAVLSSDSHPKDLPEYEHTNLKQSFRELDRRIRDVVEQITPTRYVTIPLEKRGEYHWVGRVSDEALLEKGQFFLSVIGGDSEDQLRSMILKRVKVGAEEDMDLIVNAAMPGVKFNHISRPPASIPSKTGYQYFSLESHGGFWDRVKQSQILTVYLPNDVQGVELELLATKE
ncbi:MAG: type VI secretion system baseplate subunit TssK [Nitrospirales bacterium]